MNHDCCTTPMDTIPTAPQVGEFAPDFCTEALMPDGTFGEISLEDYQNKWVVLFFYPLDFTFVCPTEILEFSKRHKEFEKLDTQVLGISTDSIYSHQAWCNGDLGKLNYPLLSDITKDISYEYEVLLEEKGIALRGTFIIDPEGVIRIKVVHDLDIGRSVDETLRVLTALQTGELCPVGWKKGKKTLGV